MADRARWRARPHALLHHHPEPVRQRPVVLAVEFCDAPFPQITYHDAIAIQHRLLTERFGITKLALVYGWSMGGMQTYHWAALHPDMVARAAVVCGSARCAPYNYVFLESVKAALTGDPAFRDGRFVEKPIAGYRAMGRVYAGWAMSHGFYRDELWREAGFTSLEDYLVRELGRDLCPE